MVGNSCLAAVGQFALGGRLEHELLRLALGESLSLARGSLSGGFRSVYAVALAWGAGQDVAPPPMICCKKPFE